MFCLKCGCELPDYANFCLNCGMSLKEQPNTIQRKRIAITDLVGDRFYFDISSTEASIIDWCKQQYLSLGIRSKSYDHNPHKMDVPGRFYFIILPRMRFGGNDEHKMLQLHEIVIDMLIRDGWKRDANGKTYTKDMF